MLFSSKPCQFQAISVLNSYLTDVYKETEYFKNLHFLPVMSTYLKATCFFPLANGLYISFACYSTHCHIIPI